MLSSTVPSPETAAARDRTHPTPSRVTRRVRVEVEQWWGGPWPMRATCFAVTMAIVRHIALWTGLDLPGLDRIVDLIERAHEDVPGA